jgi:hypothetical protein
MWGAFDEVAGCALGPFHIVQGLPVVRTEWLCRNAESKSHHHERAQGDRACDPAKRPPRKGSERGPTLW